MNYRFVAHVVCTGLLLSPLGAVAAGPGLEPASNLSSFNSTLSDVTKGGAQKLSPPEQVTDAGDAYVLEGGKQVKLLRVQNEVAVRYAEGFSTAQGLQSLQTLSGLPNLQAVAQAKFAEHGQIQLLRTTEPNAQVSPQAMASSTAVAFAAPVLVDPESRCRLIPTEQILVRLAEGTALADVQGDFAAAGLKVVRRANSRRMEVYVLALQNAKVTNTLAIANALTANPKLRWAEPNFIRELQFNYTPNDPLFNKQQNLRNTGQNGATANADAHMTAAWDMTRGNSSVVIAIIDDGVDTTHSDLRFFYNPGESGGGKETNGKDDDGNGYVDDYCGWDFANGDNNVRPVGSNGHGTGCAGVAAAAINNANLVAGVAGGCKIFPVKIADDTGVFTSDLIIGEAISYAADFADVLSNSWGGGSPSSYISTAIADATANGRHGIGCPVLFATGNAASTWCQGGGRVRLPLAGHSGNYYFAFLFQQGSTFAGENAARIDNVCLLDADGYTHKTSLLPRQDFESSTFPPSGWSLYTTTLGLNWSRSSVNHCTGTGGNWSAASPALANGQAVWLLTPLISINGTETLAFTLSTSMSTSSGFFVQLYNVSLTKIADLALWNGVPYVQTTLSFPASDANAIAVGASTDCDFRTDYSQYGGTIECVAPSNGGWNDVATLDPVGNVGWTPTDYKMNFGGTSEACPLTAGIVALVLSLNSNLTPAEVRAVLRSGCDKIGGVTYDSSGWNQYYGHGRVNAALILSNALPRFTDVRLTGTRLQDVRLSFTTLSTRHYCLQQCGSLASTPTWATVSGASSVAGTGGIVQVTDTGGASAGRRYYRLQQLP